MKILDAIFGCHHRGEPLLGPFWDESGKAYKICGGCSSEVPAPLWDERRIQPRGPNLQVEQEESEIESALKWLEKASHTLPRAPGKPL